MTYLTRITTGVAMVALVYQAPAAAQACPSDIKAPPAGSWAEYTMPDGTMRLAVLGNETRAGKSLVRMEMAMTSRQGAMIMQMLVPGYPYEMGDIQDLVMKAQGQPAMRMNEQMLGMMRSRMPKDMIAEACRSQQLTRVGEESVTVPAGTFRAIRYHDAKSNNDAWVSGSVPFGLVKTHMGQGGDMVLTGKGTDAKSQITETPQEMPGMPHN